MNGATLTSSLAESGGSAWRPSLADRLVVRLGANRPILSVSPNAMRLPGAFSFGRGWNPFLAALSAGPEALREFYTRFQPKDICGFHFLQGSASQRELPVWALPWLEWRKHRPPSAEAGLGVEHGVSYYGPCTEQKVAVEYKRLSDLLESIRRVGYVPSTPIRGFVLRRNGESRFFVRGGKHRAAVLAYLGYKAIPVSLKRGWPMIVDRREAGEWPLVRDGQISRDLAESVLDRYFDYDGSQQAAALGIATG